MSQLYCPNCRETLDVPVELIGDGFDCYRCQVKLMDMNNAETAAEKAAFARAGIGAGDGRLAGLVLALLGIFTYGTTSPFGFVLSLEKVIWPHPTRPPFTRLLDWIGLILGGVGTIYIPFFLVAMWNYSLMGPKPVLIYSTFLIVWFWHRVRIVWRWPS